MSAPVSLNLVELSTMRGPLDLSGFPHGLSLALERFDAIRAELRDNGSDYDAADHIAAAEASGEMLNRLSRGARRLTFYGVLRIAKDYGLCAGYVGGFMRVATSLNGLFYWNDGRPRGYAPAPAVAGVEEGVAAVTGFCMTMVVIALFGTLMALAISYDGDRWL